MKVSQNERFFFYGLHLLMLGRYSYKWKFSNEKFSVNNYVQVFNAMSWPYFYRLLDTLLAVEDGSGKLFFSCCLYAIRWAYGIFIFWILLSVTVGSLSVDKLLPWAFLPNSDMLRPSTVSMMWVTYLQRTQTLQF